MAQPIYPHDGPDSTLLWSGNPLATRADVLAALHALTDPLERWRSPGAARVRLDGAGAVFDRAAADLEGFSRPLWGLAPAALGGDDSIDWAVIARGLAHGCDPDHPEYWGAAGEVDQRMVEMAALGFALALVPDKLWAPLSEKARGDVARFLGDAYARRFADNNWKYFRIMIRHGLARVGVTLDPVPAETYHDELDAFLLDDGWFRDGPLRRADHYVAFAIHFYGLIGAKLDPASPRSAAAREHARAFAPQFRRFFAEDGGVVAFGRSMTYRFAMAGFWAALAFADEAALPWGEIKGLWLAHLRWWRDRPILDRDGVMTVGYGYRNLIMSEEYNSAGSPYWALKAFLPLALPADHPFWLADEIAPRRRPDISAQRAPGFVLFDTPGDVVALASGQENLAMRHGHEKYGKFAYSARYGFSVETDGRFAVAAAENMLLFSEDGQHFRGRETCDSATLAGDVLHSRWRPFADVEVETWLIPAPPWHIRVHRIRSPRALTIREGGFSIARPEGAIPARPIPGGVAVETATDVAAILALEPGGGREAVAHPAQPNINLVSARTLVPQLRGTLAAGETVLVTAVLAVGDAETGRAALARPPASPDLDALFHQPAGVPVGVL